jgi:hypothetical protein
MVLNVARSTHALMCLEAAEIEWGSREGVAPALATTPRRRRLDEGPGVGRRSTFSALATGASVLKKVVGAVPTSHAATTTGLARADEVEDDATQVGKGNTAEQKEELSVTLITAMTPGGSRRAPIRRDAVTRCGRPNPIPMAGSRRRRRRGTNEA